MKRRIALLTAICMVLFSMPVFGAEFADMPPEDSRYHDAFVYAINKQLISGDGVNLNPNSYITQAEALTIISRIKPFDCEETDITAMGVSKDKWYYSTVAKAYTLGYITADTLSPERFINRISANNIIGRVYDKTPTPWPNNEICTRAEFIWEIYWQAPDGYQYEKSDQSTTPTEAPTEFTDLKAQAAQEAMQVALGIRADGSSYVDVVAYKDYSQTGWESGRVTNSGSNRPSSGGSNRPDDNDEPDEDETNAPTQAPTDKPDNTPTDPPVQEPTDAPTQEPTYGDYDGPIDNDKDNVIDDPFNDGWRPPGWDGDDDEGEGGWDEEDDDFNINDADDPDYVEPTERPTEDPTDEPSEDETDAPTQEPTDDETDEPSDDESDGPSQGETDEPSDDESDEPSQGETDEPSDDESNEPSQDGSDNPSDDETILPPIGEDEENDENTDEPSDGETDDEDNADSSENAVLLSKDW